MNTESIKKFLIDANANGYGNPNIAPIPTADGGSLIQYTAEKYKFSDFFYGGHPYAGQEIIYFNEKPIWAMQYRGWINDNSNKPSDIYSFLKEALLHAPAEHPYRGPEIYQQNPNTYKNVWNGDMSNFSGREMIVIDDKQVYEALYFGGLVNQ